MATTIIKVKGLAEISRKLKLIDDQLPKTLRVALNEAAEIVASDARRWVPKRTGRTAASIRASSTQGKVRVRGGGGRIKHYGWLEFGGERHGRGGGIAKRAWVKKGRYIWRSLGKNRDEVVETISAAVARAVRQAGLEVKTSG